MSYFKAKMHQIRFRSINFIDERVKTTTDIVTKMSCVGLLFEHCFIIKLFGLMTASLK